MSRKCTLCGKPIPFEPGKRGRPPEFHPDCKRLWNILPWMEDIITKIDSLGIEPQKRTSIRSRLFSMANLLNYKRGPIST
jgi:hypothetical protein